MQDVNSLFFNHASVRDLESKADYGASITAIDAVSRINNQSCFIIDFDEHSLLYRSEQLVYIDEATLKDKQRECANPYWSLISEETLDKLLLIKNNYLLVGEQLTAEDYIKHVCTIDYPIILRNHELYINQKFTPLQMRNDGITKSGIFTINYSNKREIESTIIAPSGRRFRFDFKDKEYKEFNLGITLSLVEKAILHRARKGMTNEEIAQSLFISVNTVKTHRMRIFKKLKVETITEALAVVGNYQLL